MFIGWKREGKMADGGAGEEKRKGKVLWDNSFVQCEDMSLFFRHLPKAHYDCFNGKLNDQELSRRG